MTEAILGLVGVLLGGLITAGIAYALERQCERKAVRAAARLLLEVLVEAYAASTVFAFFPTAYAAKPPSPAISTMP